MANLAVFASGNGTNFQALAEALEGTRHRTRCLVADNPGAYALERARRLGVPSHVVSYAGRSREETEAEIIHILDGYRIDLVALAGYMRLLSPRLIDAFPSKIVNIHPSLLPKHPGRHGIAESFASGDSELGITVHYVDYGLDSGPIILQESFSRSGEESIEEIENTIHGLEHRLYPRVVLRLLDAAEGKGEAR